MLLYKKILYNLTIKIIMTASFITVMSASNAMNAPAEQEFPTSLRINNKTNNQYEMVIYGPSISAVGTTENIPTGTSLKKISLKKNYNIGYMANILIRNKATKEKLLILHITKSIVSAYSQFHLWYIKNDESTLLTEETFDVDPTKGKDDYLIQLDLNGINLRESRLSVIAVQK